MDIAAIATAAVAAETAKAQMAVAAKIAQMGIQQGDAVAQLLQAADANAGRLANVAAGIGTSLDITA